MTRWVLLLAALCGVLAGCGGDPGGGPPQTFVAKVGKTTYPPGKLYTGETIVCKGEGGHVGARVPRTGHGVAGSGFIVVEHNQDGSVVVECHPPPSGSTGGFG